MDSLGFFETLKTFSRISWDISDISTDPLGCFWELLEQF